MAANVCARLNALPRGPYLGTTTKQTQMQMQTQSQPQQMQGHAIAALIPMDGFHLSRAQLSALPDPALAHARRGAAFTFDGDSFLQLVLKLREPIGLESRIVYAPSFDHAIKDPVPDDIAIPPNIRIVLFEGNYLSLNRPPWNKAAALMDELWFVEIDLELARRRLVARHVKAGLEPDAESAHRRVTSNDLVSAEEIIQHRIRPVHEIIRSMDDYRWTPQAQGVLN